MLLYLGDNCKRSRWVYQIMQFITDCTWAFSITYFVGTRFWYVTDPFDSFVSLRLLDSKVPHHQSWVAKHHDLEIQWYWWFLPLLDVQSWCIFRCDGHRTQSILCQTIVFIECPQHCLLFWSKFAGAIGYVNLTVQRFRWDRNFHGYVLCGKLAWE